MRSSAGFVQTFEVDDAIACSHESAIMRHDDELAPGCMRPPGIQREPQRGNTLRVQSMRRLVEAEQIDARGVPIEERDPPREPEHPFLSAGQSRRRKREFAPAND